MDTTTPFDGASVPYHPPAVKPGSCTTADIKAFDDYMRDNPQANVDDVKAMLTKKSERCGDCAFGAVDDEAWAPIVSDATSATVNGGGCVSVVSGKDECGKAYQQWNSCLNTVCAACTDGSERTQCTNSAQETDAPCGELGSTLFKACGKNVNTYLDKCFGNGIGAVLEQLCGAPAKDGGS